MLDIGQDPRSRPDGGRGITEGDQGPSSRRVQPAGKRDTRAMVRVNQAGDIETTAALAREIWSRHYVPIIGQAQTDYMLARFQSAAAIAEQIAGGYEYYLVTEGGLPAGYFAIVPRPAERRALLSKIYVRQERRGTGLGRAIVAFVEERCAEAGIEELWLTVNRHNSGSIAFYRRMGFATTGSLVQDIGNGFVMDDYRMAKKIGSATG